MPAKVAYKEKVIALFEEGKLSHKQIADALGLTKGQVAGTIFRHRYGGDPRGKRRTRFNRGKGAVVDPPVPPITNRPKPQLKLISEEKPVAPKFDTLTVPVDTSEKTVLNLGTFECHFITGKSKTGVHTYCGEHVQTGSSYCPHHHAIVWLKPRVNFGGKRKA